MNCCQCQGIEAVFDPKHAAKELENYRRKGPAKTTRLLIDALKSCGVEGMTLLDIGGGVGAIQHALLRAGVTDATDVDASPAYLHAAQEEAEQQGHADRVTYHAGDFVDLADGIEPADIVTLDRVICCYHDMESLVGLSSERARRLYGLVYPRDAWWVRMAGPIANLFFRLRRNPFRIFFHPTEAVEAVLRRNGLKRRFHQQTFVWQVVVYERAVSGLPLAKRISGGVVNGLPAAKRISGGVVSGLPAAKRISGGVVSGLPLAKRISGGITDEQMVTDVDGGR